MCANRCAPFRTSIPGGARSSCRRPRQRRWISSVTRRVTRADSFRWRVFYLSSPRGIDPEKLAAVARTAPVIDLAFAESAARATGERKVGSIPRHEDLQIRRRQGEEAERPCGDVITRDHHLPLRRHLCRVSGDSYRKCKLKGIWKYRFSLSSCSALYAT